MHTETAPTTLVEDDLGRWLTGLPAGAQVHPDPHEENGLPPGWRIRSRYAEFALDTDLVLVRRDHGDWLVLRHARAQQHTSVLLEHQEFAGLYRLCLKRLDRDQAFYGGLAGWLHRVSIRMFDDTDPDEAAEQMLAALGSPVRVFPRATR